jgi:hypothetical protein
MADIINTPDTASHRVQAKPNPKEMLRQLKDHGANIYRTAYEQGMSLSAFLEIKDPSGQYPGSRLDAFGRLMAEAGIFTRSNLAQGIYASTYDQFAKSEARALLPEWWAREWRKAQTGQSPNTRTLWDYSDFTVGSAGRPYFEDPRGQWDFQLAPAIPLTEIVGITVPIERPDYRAHYLTHDEDQLRMGRVQAGTDIPLAKLTSGDRTIEAHKYGRALQATYEQLMFQRIDEIAMVIQRMAIQAEVDKVAAAIDVLISGDGNSGTSASAYNLTTVNGSNPAMDAAATAGTLTTKGWLNFMMQFPEPYMATTALTRNDVVIQLLLLNLGSANIQMFMATGQPGMTSFRSINQTADNIALGRTSNAPADTIVAFDKRLALKRLTVIGASISEIERYIRNQTEIVTMTEMEAFAIIDGNSVKTLNINA